MTVFKATNSEMECTMGKGTFRYALNVPATADDAKCGAAGLHACEYVLDCMLYYSLSEPNRFFLAEAEGDIAEDGENTRISCTKLTLLQELSHKMIAGQAMIYMVNHPRRDGWITSGPMLKVMVDKADMLKSDGIAIARGRHPRVKGTLGAHLGLLQEDETGSILDAKLFTVDGKRYQADTWYTMESIKEVHREI